MLRTPQVGTCGPWGAPWASESQALSPLFLPAPELPLPCASLALCSPVPSVPLPTSPALLLPSVPLPCAAAPPAPFLFCVSHCLSPALLRPPQLAKASSSHRDRVSSFLVFSAPGTSPGHSGHGLGWGSRGDPQGCCPLLQDPSPVTLQTPPGPSSTVCLCCRSPTWRRKVRTLGPWVRGGDPGPTGRARAWALVPARRPSSAPRPEGRSRAAALLTAQPTLHAGLVPPEDAEYEYSEYSVEEYHGPDPPQEGNGEDGAYGARPGGLPSQPEGGLSPADILTPLARPLLASAGRGLLCRLHSALVPPGWVRGHGGLSPLCLRWLWRKCQPF